MSQSSNSSTKSSSSSHAREEFTAQPIERRKVDPMRLVQKLRDRYGTDENGKPNFHVTLRLNKYTVFAPERLTDSEINEFSVA